MTPVPVAREGSSKSVAGIKPTPDNHHPVATSSAIRQNRGSMTHRAKKWLMFALRWGVAVAGIGWVVSNMTLRDHVTILDDHNRPLSVMLVAGSETSGNFEIYDPTSGAKRTVRRSETINLPEQK